MEKEKKQNSSNTLLFGLIAFIPIVILFIAWFVLYLRQPLHGWSLHSLGGLVALSVSMLSRSIMPLSIIFSVLAIRSKVKRAKLEQTTHDKIGFILAIASCLIVVCCLIVIMILLPS